MKRKFLALLMILAMAFSTVACGAQESKTASGAATEKTAQQEAIVTEAEVPEEKVLTLGTTGYFCNSHWDGADGWEGMYIQSYGVAETLFHLDDNYVPQPWLAESIERVDDLTWKLTLRDGVVYHNGDKMTAESVKKCLERTAEMNTRAADSVVFTDLKANGLELTMTTATPMNDMENILADSMWVIYNPDNTEDFKKQTYYTGPFIPTEFDANRELTVVKNENYWGEEPKIDKAILRTYNDEDALIMALQSGDIDIVVPLSANGYRILQGDDRFEVAGAVSTRGQFLQLNMERPVFQDPAVRQAISMCIDRSAYSEGITHGLAAESYGLFPESVPFGGWDQLDPAVTSLDVEGAAKVLAEAGYADTNGDGTLDKDGVELTMTIVTFSNYKSQIQLYQILQQNLKQIGVRLEIQALETPNDYVRSGDFDIKGGSMIMAPTGTAEYFISTMFYSKGGQNFGHYNNPEMDELIDSLKNEQDSAKCDELILEIQKLAIKDLPIITFAHERFSAAYNKNTVKTYISHPSELYILDSMVEMN